MLFLYLDYVFNGSILPLESFAVGNPLGGATGLLFSPEHGILTLAPVALLAMFGWWTFVQKHGGEAAVLAGGFLPYFCVMAFWSEWEGGWCFGPRLVVPVIPFLMVPLCDTLPTLFQRGRIVTAAVWMLCLLSVCFNAFGALGGYWSSHPLTMFAGRGPNF